MPTGKQPARAVAAGPAPKPGERMTRDGQYTMAYWWSWSESVERGRVACYEPFMGPEDLVFDIGAHRGRKTLIFRWLGARVVAVEPLFAFGDEFVPEFGWKFGQDPMVRWVPKAVSDVPVVTIQVNRFMPYVSSVDVPWMTTSVHAAAGEPYYAKPALIERQVPAITLDGLIGIYGVPRFIKIDVEGHENTVARTLTTPVDGLNLEYHEDWIPEAGMLHVESLGRYEWNATRNNDPAWWAPAWMGAAELVAWMRPRLEKRGEFSWGDVYGRRVG